MLVQLVKNDNTPDEESDNDNSIAYQHHTTQDTMVSQASRHP
jgi:hypothetical protein